ncbi:MAG: PHP domain-containing protein [Spirochaetota bacterium]
MQISADLHIHSCLSPCGSLAMSPRKIADAAAERGLEMLALTDHNSCRNAPAFEECCRKRGILPLFGMEVTSSEEAHVVCLFGEKATAMEFGEYVESRLPEIKGEPHMFGDQVYVDAEDNILGEVSRALIGATDISIDQLVPMVHEQGGLIFPAHIDRPAFSIVMQLGFLPDLPYDAVECIDPNCEIDTLGLRIITNSDAHYPEDIGTRPTEYAVDSISFEGLKAALTRPLRF